MEDAPSNISWGRQLPNAVTEPDDLGQHLVVEDKVVGVLLERQALQDLPGECPVPGVVFRQLLTSNRFSNRVRNRLRGIYKAACHPPGRRFPESAMQGPYRTLHKRSLLKSLESTLACIDNRVNHDNDVRTEIQGRPVTALLVPAVPKFFLWMMVLIPMRRAISAVRSWLASSTTSITSSTISRGSRYRSSRAYPRCCRRAQ